MLVQWLLLGAAATAAPAATIAVPADRPTIQAAIDVAGRGDIIVIQPGDYAETLVIGIGHDGVSLTAADPADPPRIVGFLAHRETALRIDHVDDVVVDGLRVRGVAEAVRVTNARRVRLVRIAVDDVGTGLRLRGVAGGEIDECVVRRTSAGPGLRIDASRDVAVTDLLVEDAAREGALLRRSTGLALVRATVVGARGRSGIAAVASPAAMLSGCEARANARDGVHVARSAGLRIEHTRAEANGGTGLRIDRSRPIWAIDDLVTRGNRARANGRHDMLVTPPRCGRRVCPRPPTTTTTTNPATSTSTTVTTTTAPTTPPSLPTTTSMTTTTGPLAAAQWRLYVRISEDDAHHRDVYVPYRAIDPALAVGIRPADLGAFRIGDQVTTAEIAALGGDTLARFVNAARAYILANPADYAGAAGDVSLRWAKRDS